MSTNSRSDPKLLRAFERSAFRAAVASLFWAAIQERRRQGSFTLQELAKAIGSNKSEVSRWFSRSDGPNWTLNTVASIADALDLELKLEARDRSTGAIITPAGVQQRSKSTARKVDDATAMAVLDETRV